MSKPRFYAVRPGFWVHGVKKEPIGPGTVVELTDEQAETHAHQVEAAPKGSKPGEKVDYAVVPDETAPEAPPEPEPADEADADADEADADADEADAETEV